MTLISGVLKGPYGDARSGVTITMRSLKTSATVLSLAKSQSTTDDGGKYAMSVEPGSYEVVISVYGAQPERVGSIEVYVDSLPGSLNDFLRGPGENDITPEIVQTVDRLRAEAAESAKAAKESEKSSELNAAKLAAGRFSMPEGAGATSWHHLGTVKGLVQNGDSIRIEVTGSPGYNGLTYQNGMSTIIIRTGSGSVPVNKKQRASATIYLPTAAGGPISEAVLVESVADTYDLYIKIDAWTNKTFYTVQYKDAVGKSWTHVGKVVSSAPTSELEILMVRQWDDSRAIPKSALDPNLLSRGDYGIGIKEPKPISVNNDAESFAWLKDPKTLSQFFRNDRGGSNIHPAFGASIVSRVGDAFLSITGMYQSPTIVVCTGTETTATPRYATLLSTHNTTTDANGFIKKASPIARLSGNPELMPDDYLEGFVQSGFVAVNEEASGVSAERISVGVYKVTGSLGFAAEGWGIEIPQDVNGNRLCFVSVGTGKDGVIYVKVSKRRFDIDTATVVAGEPMDIPEGRWIDLRLAMPANEEAEKPLPEANDVARSGLLAELQDV